MPVSSPSVIVLYFLSVCIICSSSQKQQKLTNLKETEIKDGGGINIEDVIHNSHSENEKTSDVKNNGQQANPQIEAEKYDHINSGTTNKIIPQIAMEGGGVVQPASTLGNPALAGNSTVIEDGTHTKGSKGRKGVDENQVPSVVARKGVNQEGSDHHSAGNNSLISENPTILKESTLPMNTEKPVLLNITEYQAQGKTNKLNEKNQKVSHAKKPDFVSDEGDTEDNDRYIKSSTTGEDYVVIGIVIVIGIWFSVFGALIFYRRAGEYWDRRHYRRMDFLVEGMYND
uniref:Uncharacterized protein n=1 Tax=Graphocephala atropunctata TaxID=36148 RepID=A0A1B6KZF1_9HEMI